MPKCVSFNGNARKRKTEEQCDEDMVTMDDIDAPCISTSMGCQSCETIKGTRKSMPVQFNINALKSAFGIPGTSEQNLAFWKLLKGHCKMQIPASVLTKVASDTGPPPSAAQPVQPFTVMDIVIIPDIATLDAKTKQVVDRLPAIGLAPEDFNRGVRFVYAVQRFGKLAAMAMHREIDVGRFINAKHVNDFLKQEFAKIVADTGVNITFSHNYMLVPITAAATVAEMASAQRCALKTMVQVATKQTACFEGVMGLVGKKLRQFC